MKKTNAMRILDANSIKYETTEYDVSDGKIDGISVASKVNKVPNSVFKTLVTTCEKELFIFVVPVTAELDLKLAAQQVCKKQISMLPQKMLLPMTGYVHGGCTAIGMKKKYPVFLDISADKFDKITVSAGKIGLQITLEVSDYLKITSAALAHITKEN